MKLNSEIVILAILVQLSFEFLDLDFIECGGDPVNTVYLTGCDNTPCEMEKGRSYQVLIQPEFINPQVDTASVEIGILQYGAYFEQNATCRNPCIGSCPITTTLIRPQYDIGFNVSSRMLSVWNEWKTNTKRKSRQIQINLEGTGGGPPTNKTLTDLEQQVLDLISKIHLGDPAVTDTFSNKENDETSRESITIVWENDYVFASSFKEIPAEEDITTTLYGIENETSENIDYDPSKTENQTIKRAKSPLLSPTLKRAKSPLLQTQNKTDKSTAKVSNSKYTTSLLSSACENYAGGQKQLVAFQKLQAECLSVCQNWQRL